VDVSSCASFSTEASQRLMTEPSPDLARIHELSLPVKAQWQCPKAGSTPARVRATADDEFLFLPTWEYDIPGLERWLVADALLFGVILADLALQLRGKR
jgi:hypothetical protein